MKSPEKPTENIIVVAVVDKNTKEVTIVNDKKVPVTKEEPSVTADQEVIQTVYTTTVIQKTINEDKTLRTIVNKVNTIHKDLKDATPTQVIMEKIGDKVLSTVTYEGKKISTVVYDEKTEEVKEISSQPVPENIKPLVYETEKSPEGITTIVTNSVEKIAPINKNFKSVISEIKQVVPSIQTEKIEGVKIVKSDVPDAPQKITVLFQSEKENEQTQIVIMDQVGQKPVIMDVQTILQEEIVPVPEPVQPVKLSPKEIKEQKIETILTTNIKELPFKEVRKVVEVHEVKTAYTTTLEMRVEDGKGEKYIVRTEKQGNEEPRVVDYVKVTEIKKPEVFTVTSTDIKNGIVSTYTNDVKVMSDEKTFNKCIDALEKQRNLSKRGYVVDSETVSRLQRSVEHHIRFINKETKQGIDFRVIADSRTGVITINEETEFTLGENEPSTVPQEKSFMEIRKGEYVAAEEKHDFLKSARSVLAKADYTFEGKIPDLTQVKQYKKIDGKSTAPVEVIFLYFEEVNGKSKKTRVVLLGEEKQTGKGYIMKIIDITTLPDVIQSTETKVVIDEYNRKTTTTNDIKTLEKNNQEYVKVIDFVREDIPSLHSAEVSSVNIQDYLKTVHYTMMIKKGNEIIETKAIYDKSTDTTVISDFKTQSTKSQVERVPIKEVQTIVSEIPQEKLSSPEYVDLKKEITSHTTFGQNVEIKSIKVEQNPRVDSYVIKVVDEKNVESTVTAFKNPGTGKYTIVNTITDKPAKPVEQEPVRTKETTTEFKTDSVTGSKVVTTNDYKVIRETPVIQNVVKKVVQENTIPKTSEVVSAVTKTS